MGNWNINIQGIGCHGNNGPEIDADLMAIEFVAFLRSKGHTIESASFTHGGKIDINEKSHPAEAAILINGDSVIVPRIVSYEKIKELAGFMIDIVSITYRKARFGKQGILSPGKEIEVADGTIFNVADTSNA